MNQRLRLTVGRKLMVLAGTGVLVATAIGIANFVSLGTVHSSSDLRTVLNKANVPLIDLDMQQSNVQIAERDALLATSPPSVRRPRISTPAFSTRSRPTGRRCRR